MRTLPLLLWVGLAATLASCATGAAEPSTAPPGNRTSEPATKAPDPAFRRELEVGAERFEAGNLDAAELRFERALRIDPRSAEAWNGLARVSYERGDLGLCIERADNALRFDPDNREARLNRGLALFGARRYGPALAEFRRILAYPVEEGKIVDYSVAYQEWRDLTRDGRIDVSFPVAVSRQLLPVDREAMLARWYARLTEVLQKGPGFDRKFIAQTEHYRVVTDDSESLARLVADRLEKMLVEYARLLPPPEPRDLEQVFRVTVFSDREDYVRYLSDVLDDPGTAHISGGSYHPLLRNLFLAKGTQEDRTLLVLQHEGFHQYSYAMLARVPPWFGEGIADYFAPSQRAGDRMVVGGPHPLRAGALQTALGAGEGAPRVDLRSLLLADAAVFMAAGDSDVRARSETVGRNYALAWAFVHFLVEADGGARLPLLRRYFRSLRSGLSQREAYDAVFASSTRELADRFTAYCREALLPPPR